MPTIPLLNSNLELAMPQVPALDRVPRPQIDARGVLTGMQELGNASQRRPVDERPFVAAAGAKDEAMGEGLKAAGDVLLKASSVFGALGQKRQQAHEDQMIQQFHADMRRENERRLAYQAATPDASKWGADAQSGAQRVTKQYENVPGVRPEVQQQLRGKATSFKTVTDIDTQARVDKAGFAGAAVAYAENIDATSDFGDYVTADRLIEEGGKRGYFSQDQVQDMLAQTAQRRRDDQLMTVVQEHPQEAPGWFAQEDKLTEYKLTPWERQEWEHRAQSFWEDHERQSVGRVLDGMASGQIREVKQLEAWKQEMGPKAYADISEMLAARRPAGIAKNDPAMKEQTLATIANAQVRPEEVDSQIAMARLSESIKSMFTGGNRDELLGRLKATVDGLDAAKNMILGPALQWLNEKVLGQHVKDIAPKAVTADAGPDTASPLLPHQATPPASMIERVKSIRQNLEEAIKTGKLRTAEDATDYVAKKDIAPGRPFPQPSDTTKSTQDPKASGTADRPSPTVAGVANDIFVPPSEADISVVNGVYNLSPTARLLYNESAKDGMTVHTTRAKGVESVTKTPGSLATIAGPLILTETISEGDRGDLVRSTAVFHESFHKLQQKYRADPNSVPEAVRQLIKSVRYPEEVIESADMEARRVQNIIIQEISRKTGQNHPLLKVYGNEKMKAGTEIGYGFVAPENVPATTPPFPERPKPPTKQAKPEETKK
jgi:hypothetical protein